MTQTTTKRSKFFAAMDMFELTYHLIVRDIRSEQRHAVVGIFFAIFQTLALVIAFFALFSLLGVKGSAIRGDFILYIMSGVMPFMVHTKAMGAVFKATGSTSALMQHAPLNTIVTISAAAMTELYIQILALSVVLFGFHTLVRPITIDNPVLALGVMMLAWLSGVAVGLIFLSLKPWLPNITKIVQLVYQRANMVTSGKMFVANSMPGYLLAMFAWNPLFHCVDQMRGAVFLNYTPHNSSLGYPLLVTAGLFVLGMMAEFFTRQRASSSWGALQ